MSLEAPPTVPPGWYADPAGSGGYRWWDGADWTAHLHQPEPTPVVPPVPPLRAEPYPTYAPAYSQPISNRASWLSLGLGLFALAVSILYSAAKPGGWIFSTSSIFAIVWGIRGLIRVRAGTATVRWAAIVGIVAGSLAVALMLLSFTSHALLPSLPQDGTSSLGSYPDNPEMSSMTNMAYQIEHTLRQHASEGAWPAALAADATGAIAMQDGTALGTMASGWTFQYHSVGNGQTFEFTIHGNVEGEYVDYLSSTKEINGYCLKTDTTCFPADGPVAPSTGAEPDQANT